MDQALRLLLRENELNDAVSWNLLILDYTQMGFISREEHYYLDSFVYRVVYLLEYF